MLIRDTGTITSAIKKIQRFQKEKMTLFVLKCLQIHLHINKITSNPSKETSNNVKFLLSVTDSAEKNVVREHVQI
jgi:hypothetical protein